MQEDVLVPMGLLDDPNSLSLKPTGGLRMADNVVVRRAGVIEPRPGFYDIFTDTDLTDEIRALVPFLGHVLAFTDDAIYDLTANQAAENSIAHPSETRTHRTASARKNLYFTTSSGVGRLSRLDGDVGSMGFLASLGTAPMGLVAGASPLGGDPAFDADSAVAYRADYTLKVVGTSGVETGLVIESAPTSRMVLRGDGSNDYQGEVFLPLPADVDLAQGTYTVRLFRSGIAVPRTSEPDDEMFLVADHVVTADDVTDGYVTLLDKAAPDDQRGEALYTNSSQQGALAANNRAPLSRDLCLFAGSLFHGYTGQPARIIERLLAVALEGVSATPGIATQTYSGVTWTIGSDTITGVGFFGPNIRVGMSVSTLNGAWNGPNSIGSVNAFQGGVITGWDDVAGEIYVSVHASASGTGYVYSGDVITVGNVSIAAANPVVASAPLDVSPYIAQSYMFLLSQNADPATRARETAAAIAGAYNFHSVDSLVSAQAFDGDSGQPGNIVFEQVDRGESTAFTMDCSYPAIGAAWSPPCGADSTPLSPTGDEVTVTSTLDVRPNGLAWSKSDQPEHVPFSNITYIGREDAAILRMVATRDAMFIFKADGIWRLTGSGADAGWRIDPFDTERILVAPETAQSMNNQVLGLFDCGIAAVGDGGMEMIGANIEHRFAQLQTLLRWRAQLGPGNPTSTFGASSAAHESTHEYMIALPTAAGASEGEGGDPESDGVYVFNTKTNAWTRYDFASRALMVDPADDAVVLVSVDDEDARHVKRERVDPSTEVQNYDNSYAVSVVIVINNVVTIDPDSGWVPAIGDALVNTDAGSPAVVRVLSVIDDESFTVDDGSTLDEVEASVTAYVAFASAVEFFALAAGGDGINKQGRQIVAQFDDARDLHALTFGFQTEVTESMANVNATPARPAGAADRPLPLRVLVPRNFQRCNRLVSRITIAQAMARWRCAGIVVTSEQMSERVGV